MVTSKAGLTLGPHFWDKYPFIRKYYVYSNEKKKYFGGKGPIAHSAFILLNKLWTNYKIIKKKNKNLQLK